MSLLEAISKVPSSVIIVDDDFADPILSLTSDMKVDLFTSLEENDEQRNQLAETLGQAGAEAGVLVDRVVQNIETLREAHTVSPIEALTPIFEEHDRRVGVKRSKLKLIEDYCVDQLGVKPGVYSTLESARQALQDCLVAFIDFHLKSETDSDDAIVHHARFRESYLSKCVWDGCEWQKIIVLISYHLPPADALRLFREQTGIRSCFFSSIPKISISDRYLAKFFSDWSQRYDPARTLDGYLDQMSKVVTESSNELVRQIREVETHDLAILSAAKLVAEQESLQSYLTWLISESLAAKVRSQDRLSLPSLSQELAMQVPLDGKLPRTSTLFDLFSEIASYPIPSNGIGRPMFGDVYRDTTKDGSDHANGALLLVVSPACDIIRASDEDDVLCVRGKVLGRGSADTLLPNLNYLFGKGMHAVRVEDADGLFQVEWSTTDSKGLVTVPFSDLNKNERYIKISRLAEMFAQEIKEMALSKAGRVGVPVEPVAFSQAKVLVRYKYMRQGTAVVDVIHDLDEFDFVSVIVSYGRLGDEKKPVPILVFTQQFVDWLSDKFLRPLIEETEDPPTELRRIEEYLKQASALDWRMPKSKKALTKCEGKMRILYVDDIDTLSDGKHNMLEIVVHQSV